MFYMRVRRVEEAYERGERNMEQSREILEIEGRNDTLTQTHQIKWTGLRPVTEALPRQTSRVD